MIAPNLYSHCMSARPYYYYFLSEQTRGEIPESTLEHIIQCVDCQSEIDRLKSLFERLDEETPRSRNWRDRAITSLLGLHFGYANQPVNCSMAKPFLASMADPALKIRIATPITRHVDECSACRDDLLNLRNLHITERQLNCLGRFLADKASEDAADPVSCSRARPAIGSVGSMAFHKTNTEILNHLCTCPDCRRQLYLHRENLRGQLSRVGNDRTTPPCESVSTADIYDFCVPYGIDPTDEQYVKSCQSVGSHIRNCPTCLAKMQDLHDTVYGIAERPDSEVVTCLTLDLQCDGVAEDESNAVSSDRMIDVQSPRRAEHSTAGWTEGSPVITLSSLKQSISPQNLKRYAKPTIAAAAAIVIAYASFFSTPPVEGTAENPISESIEEVRNVRATHFRSGRIEPANIEWASQTLNVLLYESRGSCTLWDLANKVKKQRISPQEPVETTEISAEEFARTESRISNSFGLLPFSRITDLREGAVWSKPDNQSMENSIPGTEVHDLVSTTGRREPLHFHKSRYFVDTGTDLPRRLEYHSKRGSENEYTLESFTTVTHPTDDEIKQAIRSRFGQ